MKLRILKLFVMAGLLSVPVCAADILPWSLEQCLEYATTHNSGVLQASAQIEIQKTVVQSVKMNSIPNFNAQFGYMHNLSTMDTQRFKYPLAYIFANGTIFDGLIGINNINYQKAQVEVNEAYYEMAMHNLEVQISTIYLQAAFLEEQERLIKASLDTAHYSDETERLQAELQLADAVNQNTGVRLALAKLVGVPEPLEFRVNVLQTHELSEEELDIQEMLQDDSRVEDFPSVRYAKSSLKAMNYNLKIAKGSYSPTVSWTFQMGSYFVNYYEREDYQAIYGPFSRQLTDHFIVTPQINFFLPLSRIFKAKNSIRQQTLNVRNGERALDDAISQMKIEAMQAYTSVVAARAKYLLLAATADSSVTQQSNLLYACYDFLIKKHIYEYYCNND